ncbi:MAG: hypothetical protein IT328_12950 [Caldilineaceae bacterium]|nr:hypothetical protein [Caldilineaceae bacterium]
MPTHQSGQNPFSFIYRDDLRNLPAMALAHESKLHGGFAVDRRPGYGHLYYGMAGCGLLRISPDLITQEIIDLPPDLQTVNFHSTKIGEFEGKPRLFLPANNDAMVAIVTLDGDVEMTLTKPEFAEYQAADTLFKPTDTLLLGDQLLVADGYGANYISTADLTTQQWISHFGGKTSDPDHHGRFGTAHGINLTPHHHHLAIADRPHSRIAVTTPTGDWIGSHALPAGSRPCGIDYVEWKGQWVAVVGSLDDPEKDRPAPIYILDADYHLLSTVRPKEDLGIEQADHIHNVIWYPHNGSLFLICQSWNPGRYFVLEWVA